MGVGDGELIVGGKIERGRLDIAVSGHSAVADRDKFKSRAGRADSADKRVSALKCQRTFTAARIGDSGGYAMGVGDGELIVGGEIERGRLDIAVSSYKAVPYGDKSEPRVCTAKIAEKTGRACTGNRAVVGNIIGNRACKIHGIPYGEGTVSIEIGFCYG